MRQWLQATLDLLLPPQPLQPPEAALPARALSAPPTESTAPTTPEAAASALGAQAPALRHAHPRANRQTLLCGEPVAYLFRIARRRSIGLSVGPEGLVVSAPRWAARRDVDAALLDKAEWILRKLHDTQQHQQALQAIRVPWGDGCEVQYLGQPLRIVLDATSATAQACLGSAVRTADEAPGPRELRLGLPRPCEPARIRDAVQAWLMRRAREHFAQRLDHFAPQLGVHWRRLRLSSAGTRWGSAGADGGISLNWRLIHFAPAVIDYVVVHELSHLRVMDHSPRFWDTVGEVLPDYRQRRELLKAALLPPWQ